MRTLLVKIITCPKLQLHLLTLHNKKYSIYMKTKTLIFHIRVLRNVKQNCYNFNETDKIHTLIGKTITRPK